VIQRLKHISLQCYTYILYIALDTHVNSILSSTACMHRSPKWFLPLRFIDYSFVFVTHLLIDYIMNAFSSGLFCYREERASGNRKEFHLFFVPRKSLLCEKWLKVGYVSLCCN
jgi:hypothetical protein